VTRSGLLSHALPFFLLAFAGAGCDGLLIVNGRVVDEAGAPLAGARVSAYVVGPKPLRTDERGCFHLLRMTGWSSEEAPFLVEAEGHRTFLGTVTAPELHHVLVHLTSTLAGRP
jgi:hypothetical protein